MCPYGLEIDISTSLFPHLWQGNSKNISRSRLGSVLHAKKTDQAETKNEFCCMEGPHTKSGLAIGFETLFLLF